eukprot:6991108-Prymnesium_polylepis.2
MVPLCETAPSGPLVPAPDVGHWLLEPQYLSPSISRKAPATQQAKIPNLDSMYTSKWATVTGEAGTPLMVHCSLRS